MAVWPPGGLSIRKLCEVHVPRDDLLTPEGFAPIECVGPPPWTFRPVEPIAGSDEVVGGDEIVGGIGHNATPALAPSPAFRRSHQTQLQRVAAVTSYHANAAEIAGVVDTRRWDHPGESDR